MARVVVHYADGRKESRTLRPGSQIIGRDPECEFLVADASISRQHARIFTDADGHFFVEDHGSKNGTLVNGQPIRQHRLIEGDRVHLGAIELVYHDSRDVGDSSTQVVLGDSPVNLEAASFTSPRKQVVINQRRLQLLYELSDRLTSLRERGELLNDVMDICFETLSFERGLIALKHARGREPEWPVVRNLQFDSSGRLTISRTIINRSLQHGERCIINDPIADMADPSLSMAEFHIRSAMCVPIQYRNEILGVLYGDRTSASARYEQDDVDFLAGLARQVSVGLMNHRLFTEREERLQLEGELAVARKIQTDLYPKQPLVRDRVHIVGWNGPSRLVSGDYYDVMELDERRVAVVVADVAGKGMAAALLTANLQAAVRVLLPVADSLSEAMMQWNELICTNTDTSKFITAIVGVLDTQTRQFECVSAGHAAPLVIGGGEVTTLGLEPRYPLGVERNEEYPVFATELRPGTTLFFYTDGVTEAMGLEGDQFGDERLRTSLVGCDGADPGEMLRRVRTDLAGFVGHAPQSDDITILAVHCGTLTTDSRVAAV